MCITFIQIYIRYTTCITYAYTIWKKKKSKVFLDYLIKPYSWFNIVYLIKIVNISYQLEFVYAHWELWLKINKIFHYAGAGSFLYCNCWMMCGKRIVYLYYINEIHCMYMTYKIFIVAAFTIESYTNLQMHIGHLHFMTYRSSGLKSTYHIFPSYIYRHIQK